MECVVCVSLVITVIENFKVLSYSFPQQEVIIVVQGNLLELFGLNLVVPYGNNPLITHHGACCI